MPPHLQVDRVEKGAVARSAEPAGVVAAGLHPPTEAVAENLQREEQYCCSVTRRRCRAFSDIAVEIVAIVARCVLLPYDSDQHDDNWLDDGYCRGLRRQTW